MMRQKKQTGKRKEHESRDGRTVKKEKKKRDKEQQRESGIRQERSRALCG